MVLHIDMNSYFATVEQQANPLLRGKPIAVSGRKHISSVVATASIEAKKFGVKAGMSTWEAKKLCPPLIFIPGDPAKYIDTTNRLIKIFSSYSPTIEIFSIDEVFMEVTGSGLNIALEIKQRIKKEIGSHMTCSIGIASNKFLAKLASEKKKPDGLTIVNQQNLDQILLSSKLDDFCGIGEQTLKRLNCIGVFSVAQLRQVPQKYLIATFGIKGKQIHNMAFGIDDSLIIAEQTKPQAKSFSHSLTLEKETIDENHAQSILLYLCEKVARRMRAENFFGRTIVCNNIQKNLPYYINNGLEIFNVAKNFLCYPLRAIYVAVTNLQPNQYCNQAFFGQDKIISAVDIINNRFGENTIFKAGTLPAFDRDKEVAGIRTRFRFQ